MANGKYAREDQEPLLPVVEEVPNKESEVAEGSTDAKNAGAPSNKQQEEQQQAVVTLIQGVAIAQAKGGCWSIKQAGILNNAVKQLTGNAEPTALPPFDPTEAPAEQLPPQQRCVIYLIQAVGFGQNKGAYNLEQAAILDAAIDKLTTADTTADATSAA